MLRLFVAVWPPDEVLDLVAVGVARPPQAGLRWTRRDQWHVTLRFLGRTDVEPVVGALTALSCPPGEAVLGPAVGRFGDKVLQVPIAGLGPLAAAVVAATVDLGRPPDARPFSGHLTLARAGRGTGPDLQPLTGTPLSATWAVTEIALVESRLSPAGARYEVLAAFPLGAAHR